MKQITNSQYKTMSEMQYNPTRPTVTAEDLGGILVSGKAFMVGEYRGHKIERIEYNDKTTGKPTSFLKCEANVETGDGTSVPVEVRLPRGLDDPQKIALGVTKGQQVVLRLATLKEEKGRTFASVGSEADSIMLLA